MALSTVLRNPVEVSLAGVDQLAYGKFVHGLEDPSYFSVLKAEPLGDRVMLDIELAILYPMLDRLLGGHADDPPPRRPPSDIELPLAGRIVRVFLKDLQEAWQGVLPLRFEVLQVGSHPRLLRVLPSDETVVLVSFALTIGNRQGMMRLCLPCRAIRQIADKLTARGRMEPSAAVAQERARPMMPTTAARRRGGRHAGNHVDCRKRTRRPPRRRHHRHGDRCRHSGGRIDRRPTQISRQPGASQGRKAVVLSPPDPDAG